MTLGLCCIISSIASMSNRRVQNEPNDPRRKPWPELFVFILDCFNCDSVSLQRCAFKIMLDAPSFMRDTCLTYHHQHPNLLNVIYQRILRFLALHPPPEIWLHSIKAVLSLLVCLSPDKRGIFVGLVPVIVEAFPVIVQRDEEPTRALLHILWDELHVFFTMVE